jgi:hypothetical protein
MTSKLNTKQTKQIIIVSVLLFLVLFLTTNQHVFAQTQNMILEWEQHWETYGVGGTCNFGTYNFFVGDVDNDSTLELITGGMSYDMVNYSRTDLRAPFKIWNWDGESFTLEKSHEWPGITRSTFAADLDQDNLPEIITGGTISNSSGSYSTVRIWNWDGTNLVLRAHFEGVSARSISAWDFDKDGISEIIIAGTSSDGTKTSAQLSVLNLQGNTLQLAGYVEWCASTSASATSVAVSDLDNDGVAEIITGGYDNNLSNSSGQIRVWHWENGTFSLIENNEWRMVEDVYGVTITGDPMGNTIVNNLRVDDVDNDGIIEIVTGGFAFDGEKINAQLKIWNWDNQNLVCEGSQEWMTNDVTEVKAISLDDVDGDNHLDIVTAGLVGAYGGFDDINVPPEQAQLRVWKWDGENLNLKHNEEWTVGEGVVAWNVQTGDIDNDGTVEIITVGCMYVAALCDPDLRIYSIAPDQNLVLLYGIIIAIVVILVVIALFVFKRKK